MRGSGSRSRHGTDPAVRSIRAGAPAPNSDLERNDDDPSPTHRCPGKPRADRGSHPDPRPRRLRRGRAPGFPGRMDAGTLDWRPRDRARRRVGGLTVETPLEMPATPAALPWLWRAISSLGFVRRIL